MSLCGRPYGPALPTAYTGEQPFKTVNTLSRLLKDPSTAWHFVRRRIVNPIPNLFWAGVTRVSGIGTPPEIRRLNSSSATSIDAYWEQHTVSAPPFNSAHQSRKNLEWRFRTYPLFRELSGLYGEHDGEVILDYGCGPGNDLVGFAIYTRAQKIIGMDVSSRSLAAAANRLALHKVTPDRVELVQVSDAVPEVPLPDRSVDFVNCQGVLMHASYPERILSEFFRVLKPGSGACVMVYNRDSIWFHLYTAYEQIVVNQAFRGMDIEEAFSRNTDGISCPMARCYRPQDFVEMCRNVGFECEYKGGYLSETEKRSISKYKEAALRDTRLRTDHRRFLEELVFDGDMPKHNGYYAGVHGVYWLLRSSS